MAWAIRDFSQLFIYSKKLEEYSTFSRFFFALTLIVGSTLIKLYAEETTSILGFSYITVMALLITSRFKGLKSTVGGMVLLGFFTGIALFSYFISGLLGWSRLDPISTLSGTIYVLALFTSFSCLLQLISIREWRRVMSVIGLKTASLIMSLALLQTPLTIMYTSEAFTTIKLKYGSKKLYKVVIPLILLSFYTARGFAEAYVLYGFETSNGFTRRGSKDIALYLASLIVLTGAFLLILTG